MYGKFVQYRGGWAALELVEVGTKMWSNMSNIYDLEVSHELYNAQINRIPIIFVCNILVDNFCSIA